MNPIFALLLDLSGTIVSLHPTVSDLTLAEVRIYNFGMNTELHEGAYPVAMDGLTIEVEFEWNVNEIGSDRFIVIPPDGVICDPLNCTTTVSEGAHGLIVLKPYEGF